MTMNNDTIEIKTREDVEEYIAGLRDTMHQVFLDTRERPGYNGDIVIVFTRDVSGYVTCASVTRDFALQLMQKLPGCDDFSTALQCKAPLEGAIDSAYAFYCFEALDGKEFKVLETILYYIHSMNGGDA